jgi:chaperonin cofactor prefoldin
MGEEPSSLQLGEMEIESPSALLPEVEPVTELPSERGEQVLPEVGERVETNVIGETSPVIEQPPVQPPVQAPERRQTSAPPARSYVTHSEALWIALGSGLISFFLAIGFVFLFLGIINGGWHFARASEITRLEGQVETLGSSIDDLQESLGNLSDSLAALEGPQGRLSLLEGNVSQVQDEVGTYSTDIEDLQTQIGDLQTKSEALALQADDINNQMDDLSLQVDALLTRTERFKNFLDGLNTLLDSLLVPEVTP